MWNLLTDLDKCWKTISHCDRRRYSPNALMPTPHTIPDHEICCANWSAVHVDTDVHFSDMGPRNNHDWIMIATARDRLIPHRRITKHYETRQVDTWCVFSRCIALSFPIVHRSYVISKVDYHWKCVQPQKLTILNISHITWYVSVDRVATTDVQNSLKRFLVFFVQTTEFVPKFDHLCPVSNLSMWCPGTAT